ncbi:MAG: hypothetical protein H0V49_10760 [Nocardioidaceae bacterium]|nr:hypothetical protein [Nocardioidaceae bacterium]
MMDDAISIVPANEAHWANLEASRAAGTHRSPHPVDRAPGVSGILEQLDQEPAVVLLAEQTLGSSERPGVPDRVLAPVLCPFGDGPPLQDRAIVVR